MHLDQSNLTTFQLGHGKLVSWLLLISLFNKLEPQQEYLYVLLDILTAMET